MKNLFYLAGFLYGIFWFVTLFAWLTKMSLDFWGL